MKPEEMDQQKLVTWMEGYLQKSKIKLEGQRDALYDLIDAGDDVAIEAQLRDLVVGQAVHAMLLEEFIDYKEHEKMQAFIANLAKDAPEA